MKTYSLEFPNDFNAFEWELPSKGWVSGVKLILPNSIYTLTFYDPIRLSQQILDELQSGNPFTEHNMVVVSSVTKENIEVAVQKLVSSGATKSMVSD